MALSTPSTIPDAVQTRRERVATALAAHARARRSDWARLQADIAADRAARAAAVAEIRTQVRDQLEALRLARADAPSPSDEPVAAMADTPTPPPVGPAPSAAPAPAPPPPTGVDDLMALEGLTVLDRRRLLLLGIGSFEALASADTAELLDVLGPDRPVAAWQVAARERVA